MKERVHVYVYAPICTHISVFPLMTSGFGSRKVFHKQKLKSLIPMFSSRNLKNCIELFDPPEVYFE